MIDTLLSKKYYIIRVLEPNKNINYYITQKTVDPAENTFIINEFCCRDEINTYISELITLKQYPKLVDFVEYFSENSKFYLVFKHFQGQDIKAFLQKQKLKFEYKIVLIKNILCKFLEYSDIPNSVRNSMIQPNNIIIKDNNLEFNYKIQIVDPQNAITDAQVYKTIGNLINTIFLPEEIKKDQKLKIIVDKCEKGIYKSIGSILKDFEQVALDLNKNITIKEALGEKAKKTVNKFVKVLGVFALILLGYLCYKNYIQNSVEASLNQDIDKIGTVNVSKSIASGVDNNAPLSTTVYIDNSKPKPVLPVAPSIEQDLSQKEVIEKVEQETEQIYITQYGDCLSRICVNQYRDLKNLNFIVQYNNIKNKDLIYVNQPIKLPSVEFINHQQMNIK